MSLAGFKSILWQPGSGLLFWATGIFDDFAISYGLCHARVYHFFGENTRVFACTACCVLFSSQLHLPRNKLWLTIPFISLLLLRGNSVRWILNADYVTKKGKTHSDGASGYKEEPVAAVRGTTGWSRKVKRYRIINRYKNPSMRLDFF